MQQPNPTLSLEQPFCPVKPRVNTQLPLFPDSMIHHNVVPLPHSILLYNKGSCRCRPYGVSRTYRVLSPQLLLRKWNYLRGFMEDILDLAPAQRTVVFRLLTLWAYYGSVYPKESQITEDPGCSKATFWRTIRILRELGLVHVINRYVMRPHAQISNLYRLDRLVLVIARYLAEHGVGFLEKWLTPALTMPGRLFWSQVFQAPEARAGPYTLALGGP